MLNIENLKAGINGTPILNGLNLQVNAGEVHAIMGPNGAGKSTLGYVLSGRDGYDATDGQATLDGKDLLDMEATDRALEGLYLGFQYPIEVPGVTNAYLLKAAVNARRKYRGEPEVPALDFLKKIKGLVKSVNMNESMLHRGVNEGFSGGEKKRNEILQMLMLEPKLAILDETDSGLDIDALKVVADGINQFRREDRAVVLITHYQRLLDYVQPDFVHVLANGQIIKSGGPELAKELESRGYGWLGVDDNEAETRH